MEFKELFKLKSNPFRMIPASRPDEIVWAGFPEIKKKFEDAIIKAMKIPNSSFILNWGEYGSGKTHAARYFGKKSVLENLASTSNLPLPFSLYFTLPNGKFPINEIYISVIDRLNIADIRVRFEQIKSEISAHIDEITDNIQIKNVLKAIFSDLNPDILKRYLYGTVTQSEFRELSTYNILRNLDSDNDYVNIISGIFSCLTYDKKEHSTIILWIDEFEDITLYNNMNIDRTNNFIRELMDNTPNNLLIFLNLTQSALVNIEDLGEYISDALRSRIKDRIEFKIPTENEFLQYLNELLNNDIFRTEEVTSPLYPFEEDVIKSLIKELENVSIRRLNDALSLLLEIAALEKVTPINMDFFNKNKNEIIGWKI